MYFLANSSLLILELEERKPYEEKQLERKQLEKLMSHGSKKGLNISYVKVQLVGRNFFRKSKMCTVQPREHLICILVYSFMLSFVGVFILKCYDNGPITLPWSVLDLITG